MDSAKFKADDLFIIREYQWTDVSKPSSWDEVTQIYNTKTKNGTQNTKHEDQIYYKIHRASSISPLKIMDSTKFKLEYGVKIQRMVLGGIKVYKNDHPDWKLVENPLSLAKRITGQLLQEFGNLLDEKEARIKQLETQLAESRYETVQE